MSTGAGRPKFRICVTISAGKKYKVTPGKARGRQRTAPATKEEQDHRAREARGDDGFADDAANGRTDKDRLIRHGLYVQFWRQGLSDAWQQIPNALHHIERGCVACFQYAQQCAAVAILADDVSLRGKAIAHLGNISEVNGRVPHELDR
jgi:hypothetical protein